MSYIEDVIEDQHMDQRSVKFRSEMCLFAVKSINLEQEMKSTTLRIAKRKEEECQLAVCVHWIEVREIRRQ